MSYQIKETTNKSESNTDEQLLGDKTMPSDENQNSYYSDTAYFQGRTGAFETSQNKEKFNYKERTRRKFDMPKDKFCGHIVPRTGQQAIYTYNLYGEERIKKEVGERKIWEEFTWATWRNKKAVWFQITKVAFICIFIGIFVVIASFTAHWDGAESQEEKEFLFLIVPVIFFIIPVLFFFYARHKTKTSDYNNNYIFNRRTGMVSIPIKGQDPFIRPFYEFVPYYTYQSVMHGANWYLYLGHKDEPFGAREPSGSKDARTAFADWTFIQWFMDVSLPLPDIAELELYRHLDPTTAAYDKKTGRPERYWRDMPFDKARKFYDNEFDRLQEFDTKDLNSQSSVSDYYMQWPHLVELEPAEDTYEDTDAYFEKIEEEKRQKKLTKEKHKHK